MSAVATAIVGGALVGGYMTSQASKSAANTAAGAADRANAISDAQFQQTRTDMAPWRNAGSSAIGQLSYLLGLPGYGPTNQQGGGVTQLNTIGSLTSPRTTGFVDRPQDTNGLASRKQGVLADGGPAMINQKSMDDQMTGGGGGGPATGGNFDYNPDTGEWTPAANGGGTYNAQLGDFGSLSRDFGIADFQADPGYDFRMKEGQKALERSAAAGGRFLGGGTLKALTRYGQDMGSQEYGKAFDRFNLNRNTRFNQLAAVAGIGQTANGQLAQLGSQYATAQGNNLMGAATVGGNAAMAGAAGWSTALNNGVNNWLTYKGYKG